MKITTQYVSDYEYKATTSEGHTVDIDMRKEDKVDQSPMEMVLSALTGCVAVEVALMVKKRRKMVSDLIVEANANRRETAPRSFTDIHLKFISGLTGCRTGRTAKDKQTGSGKILLGGRFTESGCHV